jgi:site-specific DNA-methyltransferase (adenine-specific)
MTRKPGEVRDSILRFMSQRPRGEASVAEIYQAVCADLGDVPRSSVRSYLNLNTPSMFRRMGRGSYQLKETVSDHGV